MRDLARLAGNAAIYQLYNQIFFDRKIKDFRVKVPALEARMGGRKYYTFNMVPEHILKIAFVHQRRKRIQFQELSDSYQRILKPNRLRQIESYINAGGYFPGNVILNFTRPFENIEPIGPKQIYEEKIVGSARPVIITLPPYYGSAWIIDGQHRLYGYADSDKRYSETIPVVAFINESPSVQARIFVDINKNQQSISTDLLWDLYEDLYSSSTDEKEQHLCAVSKLAKRLNKDGPLKGKINIPKEGNLGEIDLKSLCRVLYNHNFIGNEKSPFRDGGYEESIVFACKRIKAYLSLFESYLEELWEKGKPGFICSTAGIGVLLSMLRDLIINLTVEEIRSVRKFEEYFDDVMLPLINHLSKASEERLANYTKASVGRAQSTELQAEFTDIISKERPGTFRSPFLVKWRKSEMEKTEASLFDLLKRSEDEYLEFKGSFMLNIDRLFKGDGKSILSPDIANGVLKTVAAFFNTDGGDLVIGAVEIKKYPEIPGDMGYALHTVSNYCILGIEIELESEKHGDRDYYELKLRDLFSTHLGEILCTTIKISFQKFKERTLCRIKVPALNGSDWCYVNNDHFYVRQGNRSKPLKGRDIDDYQRRKISEAQ